MYNLRVAIVGCGRMGRERAAASMQLGACIVAACDTNLQRAQEMAAGIPGCAVVREAQQLDWNSLDAVFVCTPPFARGTTEVIAIQRQIPVFMEKPIGLSAQHCALIQDILKTQPVITAVGYMNRYRESIQRARQLLMGKTILGAAGSWLGGMYRVPWWGHEELSGGPVNEQATHLVDLARYLVGEVVEVNCMVNPPHGQGEGIETASFNLRFANGQLASLLYSCQASCKMINFQVFTHDTRVRLEGWDFNLLEENANNLFTPPIRAFISHTRPAPFSTLTTWTLGFAELRARSMGTTASAYQAI